MFEVTPLRCSRIFKLIPLWLDSWHVSLLCYLATILIAFYRISLILAKKIYWVNVGSFIWNKNQFWQFHYFSCNYLDKTKMYNKHLENIDLNYDLEKWLRILHELGKKEILFLYLLLYYIIKWGLILFSLKIHFSDPSIEVKQVN